MPHLVRDSRFRGFVFGAGMNSVFNEQILSDKLSKLNKTQQCIETLSHWCIFHQSKAEQVVATWDKEFQNSQMVQKVRLLYLANDILQNSKRKGNEFVNEFWKVLPSALKDVMEKGDDRGKNVVSRLKLTVGGTAERIVSGYHLVFSEHSTENLEMSKCKSAIQHVRKIEEDVDLACRKAKDPKRKTLSKELEEEENALKQCIEKLKVVEANRIALVSQLREALHEEESELESVRTQMQVAHAQAEEASNMRKRLDDENYVGSFKQSPATPPLTDANLKKGFQVPKKSASAIAAEVADKLTASTSSQSIMTSVLSTFAAEEAKNAGLAKSTSAPTSLPSVPINSFSNVPAQLQPNTYQSIMMLPSPSQQYMQPSGGMVSSYSYGSMPPVQAPHPPHPNMYSPAFPLAQPQLQSQQQPFVLTQQNSMPLPQQQLGPPGFSHLGLTQPSGMVYYGHPNHSQ
ncbi:hypothetical protein RHMOL_Rhmol08G0010700 [Rhododendron molle]|uniref:Uncharacterized protein n=1 Tax=Rhododendron molle TaxID=49168 RepID=A0ACC0MIB5_RHOML|nr:hypothetical protein RHMOL_Rhmol08G0010700 [Rhododendron molle]